VIADYERGCACGHAVESHQGIGYFCLVEGCPCPDFATDFTGWDDGGVNDDLGRHHRRVHNDGSPDA
jgi:hypothetical protein